MHRTRARSAALATGLALLLGSTALVAPDPATAQVQQGGVVKRIIVKGNERIEPSTVISYLPIQVGDTVDSAKADLALKALFRTDLFSDVKIDYQDGDLIVTIVENPIINRVLFEGNSSLKEDKLKDEVSVRPRGIFTRAKVQSDVARILELYRRSGRISATVTPQIVELPQKRVDLIFKIDEGPKSGILRVNFLGNKAFSDNDLRGVVVTEQSHWYKFFSSNANYDPDRLEYDKEQLRKFYRNRGYYDFRVISAVAELAPDKNGFVVTYTVDEGPEYKFGKITVETELQKLNPSILQALVPIHTGEIYQDKKLEDSTDALTFAAGAAGFAFVDVRPRFTRHPETKTVDVIFDVKEGPRVYIDRIDIVGNTQTLDYVIRREMNVVEGDAYNRALVDRSKQQIKALGFFKDVDITETPGSAPDRTDLQVKVTEQPTGELSFSAGYSSVDQLVLDVGFAQHNFRGRGQDLRARASWGSISKQVDLSFTEPRFGGRDLGLGTDIFYYDYDLSQFSAYRSKSIGANVRVSFPMSLNSRGSAVYTLRNDDVSLDSSLCDPSQALVSFSICAERGSFITSLAGYGWRLDRRNDAINPSRGFFVSINQDFAGLGGDVKYVRTEGETGWYHGFNKDFILSVTGQAGFVGGWGGDHVRINDRFYKGGNDFRGFQTAGIGPRDLTFGRSDSLGGKAYAIGSIELTIPTYLPEQYGIKAALFTDFGTLGLLDPIDKLTPVPVNPSDLTQGFQKDANGNFILAPNPDIKDDLSLRASAGISIFWKSPMGPLRFDLSGILAKQPYDKTETFRFSTATRF
ncbi:outer membrane protein assembly factor BamA [Phenylobacterium sp.]|uniref:outer membrane protein assembly factor BamA n=1 Tax=Phenylobacterium sp. TaxID=1871053 RepID=UPI002611FBA5|nr:outer membrane protein assembly factor BamA [Phenylobacterium sp.]